MMTHSSHILRHRSRTGEFRGARESWVENTPHHRLTVIGIREHLGVQALLPFWFETVTARRTDRIRLQNPVLGASGFIHPFAFKDLSINHRT